MVRPSVPVLLSMFGLVLTQGLRCDEAPAAVRLIEEGFEQGQAGEVPPGWEVVTVAGGSVALTDQQPHSGRLALHVVDSSATHAVTLRSRSVPVRPDSDYFVQWWCLAPEGKASNVYIEFWDKDGKRIEKGGVFSFAGSDTGRWELRRALAVSPPNAVAATLLANSWTGGIADCLYDDIVFGEGAVETYDRTPLPPAKVKHPCGLYREADILRAKANIERHGWAKAVLGSFKSAARFWMETPDDRIAEWIPELTPIRVLDCPRCGANWDYAWQPLPEHRIRCTRCKLELPSAEYPENGRETLTNPLGQKVEYTFHEGPKGERFRISGRIRYQDILKLSSLDSLGKCYALTGEQAYAEKAVKVLRRIAQVYPGYIPHDWNHFYRDYSNLQSGKLSGWKLHDAHTFAALLTCYDLIYNSGCLTEQDKVLIENGAFREAVRLFTATSPKGCCINDGPAAMTCGALLGAVLGDHEAVKWAISPPDGFLGFVRKYFFRDGHWEDGSFSYEMMSLGPLHGCPEVLRGYSDPPEYTGADRYDNLDLLSDPLLRKVYLAPLRVLLPDRTGPPISDSAAGARYPRQMAETNYFWYPTEANLRILADVYEGKLGEEGGEYALFRRDPDADLSRVQPLNLATHSRVEPGVGWAILRAGEGKDAAALYFKYGVYGSGHGHDDKLSFLYYDDGCELITDQGYLGARHDFTPWNHSTLAHNLVLVDGEPQKRADGELLGFSQGEVFQTALAEGKAVYPQVTRYERSLSLVDHGPGRRYVVDVFRVAGGSRHDYAIHGGGKDFAAPLGDWTDMQETLIAPAAGARFLRKAWAAVGGANLIAAWSEGGKSVACHILGAPGDRLLHLTAPGLRNRSNPWEERDLHLLLVRRERSVSTFVSVTHAGADRVLQVEAIPAQCEAGEAVGLRVKGTDFEDLIVVGEPASLGAVTTCGDLTFRGRIAFVGNGPEGRRLCLVDGSELQWRAAHLTCRPPLAGKVLAANQADFTVTLDTGLLPEGDALRGEQLLICGKADGAYEIESVSSAEPGRCVVTLADEPTLNLKPGDEFALGSRAEGTW